MTRILFAGPSLAGTDPDLTGIEQRPPAAHGDLARAVLEGATVIGLVDGLFDAVAAVWHKEILFALSEEVTVLGAASMGALRAAECVAFGMLPVGVIARDYIDGRRDEDGDVGLLHAPAELGWLPLTEPLVDVEATVARLEQLGLLWGGEAAVLLEAARALHFSARTLEAMLASFPGSRRESLASAYQAHRIALKQADALELIDELRKRPACRVKAADFRLNTSPMWRRRMAIWQSKSSITLA